MQASEIIALLDTLLQEIGFVRSKKGTWLSVQKEIVLILKFQSSKWSKYFYIRTGVIFKRLIRKGDKAYTLEDSHLRHSLLNLLIELGEDSQFAQDLFSFENEHETVVNVKKIASIIEKKVNPFVGQFNNYKFLYEHFDTHIANRPFFVLYHDSNFYKKFFMEQSSIE